ncbi:COMM domain-containing protein 2 isoform X2 [Acanthochromis polyacanthus]|nr:COMM domain-containing protein 2 isoform X2 [Acanthochromis polyacanthus]
MARTQQKQKTEAAAVAAGDDDDDADVNAATTAADDVDDQTNEDASRSYGVSSNLCCIGTQTDLTGDVIEAMTAELQSLRTENIRLSSDVAHLSSTYDRSAFVDNDEKVLFFTGLPTYQILLAIYTFLGPHLPVKKSLDKFQQLILTLMRLRLNVSTTFLSYAFNVSIVTASRVVSDVIDVMFIRMKPLIVWPEREQLQKTMPMQFRKHFGTKCVVIIDCFEVFIERPSNLVARAETWSSYKHLNTIKFLIGITPQGTVSYISNAWGGRANDKYITENYGFLEKILPGDLIPADRGFNIQTALACRMAHVKIPAFTRGKSQLAHVDLETTRKIAHVRIHVERVIGCVRQKYTILEGVLPIDFLMCKDSDGYCTIDKIGLVCALVNLCPSVVDYD